MPPLTKLEHARLSEGRSRRLRLYAYLLAALLLWGALGLYWLSGASSCARTSPGVYRLATMLSFVYALVCGLLALGGVGLGIDFCLSGKLRMVVIFQE